MVLRIRKSFNDSGTTVRLCGRLVTSDRWVLSELIESSMGTVVLDLDEVTLVDLDIVQFLARREAAGVELLNCAPYVREWISRETARTAKLQSIRNAPGQLGAAKV
jgi:hypothetical protein